MFILRRNLHNIDQVKLTCTTKINALPVTSYEIDVFCGNFLICSRQMQEPDFFKTQVLNDLEQKEKDNISPV